MSRPNLLFTALKSDLKHLSANFVSAGQKSCLLIILVCKFHEMERTSLGGGRVWTNLFIEHPVKSKHDRLVHFNRLVPTIIIIVGGDNYRLINTGHPVTSYY